MFWNNCLLVALVAIAGATAENQTLYKPLYQKYSKSTPKFQNVSGADVNPLILALKGHSAGHKSQGGGHHPHFLDKRQISVALAVKLDMEAVALHKSPRVEAAPSNVELVIMRAGMQILSATLKCDSRLPGDMDLTGFTHMNFAFAYFNPTTFEMMPMNAGDPALYSQFTDLKTTYPGIKTWISVGGWSFNDATNSPNTQTAFSDMASTAANRAKWIKSLTNFMQTYGFDGVDIDWEYPGAPDRGGVNADTENYVTLVKEMRASWGSKYGISATLPSSYWYMRWFDLKGLEDSLDWFNFMSYDIHGVWDSTNKFTGPFILPHTNLTEIKLGLDLLWRNGIDPGYVTLGLGWYGRSFTLSDPSCSTPNGVCQFSSGGKPGPCTNSAGTLSNAEIFQVLAQTGAKPSFDSTAAVKWITWDTNQWVSYDDGQTMKLKIDAANNLCIGGVMIWSVDQDDTNGTSTSDLLGLGTANGISSAKALELKQNQRYAVSQATNMNSCYWTFCGDSCASGYFPQTSSNGQVNGVSSNTVCKNGQLETLCCASGTNMGTCEWEGWNGVGMSCSGGGCLGSGSVAIAFNTNNYIKQAAVGLLKDQTCHGGFQSYCCLGFRASPKGSISSLDLVGLNGKDTNPGLNVGKFAGLTVACTAAATAAGTAAGAAAAIFTFGIAFEPVFAATFAAVFAACEIKAKQASALQAVGVVAGVRTGGRGQSNPVPRPPPNQPQIPPKQSKTQKLGQWVKTSYDPKTTNDCAVTYTCKYGLGFDEICDNQSWGIDKANAGRRVYHYDPTLSYIARGPDSEYAKAQWGSTWRKSWYRTMAQAGNPARCQVDEFPMGSLWEGRAPFGNQVCRLVNGVANRRQGTDFQQWLSAIWAPCSALRSYYGKPDPPITWEFSHTPNDPRLVANSAFPHFIQKYGFDSQTVNSLCWATYQYPAANGQQAIMTASDHGFRALPNDPMYRAYGWPPQQYSINPNNAPNLPGNVASAQWQKRINARAALENLIPVQFADSAEVPIPVPCGECSLIIDEDNEVVYDQRPPAEVPLTKTAGETPTPTIAKYKKPETGNTVDKGPVETGSASQPNF
ncbi:chitotriosidase-1 [Trichoderma asperellum]|uniref:chitinase n=1 Tax=Trichoderma asperellum TaxID=101201 RepID=A0A6V8R9K7_TRIAP|nr:chitotriosidase-1 [Trichoderma asperellum]